MCGRRDGATRSVCHDEPGRAPVAAPVYGVRAVDQPAAGHAHVELAKLVDLDPHGDAADLLRSRADRCNSQTIGILARDKQYDLPSPLVIPGTARARELRAKIDQVPAHRRHGLGVGGAGSGAEFHRNDGASDAERRGRGTASLGR